MADRECGVFVSWIRHHGRSEDISRELGLTPVFIDAGETQRMWSAPFRYCVASVRTVRALMKLNPSAVMVMQPPIPAAMVAFAYCKLRQKRLVLDLHTGVFSDPKWSWARPLTFIVGRHVAACIVTNEALKQELESKRVTAAVLHDPLAKHGATECQVLPSARPFILVPCSYSNDEPIDLLLEVASRLPDVDFVFTGRAPRAWIRKVSSVSNARTTGFVPDDEYEALVQSSRIVVCLTTRNFTMQRGGYEALAAHRGLVTTDFPVLRSYFEGGAEFAQLTSDSLTDAITSALANHERLASEMADLHKRRVEESEAGLNELRTLLFDSVND